MPHNYRQREKTLEVFAPCCGAKMDVCYDGTGDQWERSTDLPTRCPKGHALTRGFRDDSVSDMHDALHAFVDQRARDGVGDFDVRDLCGYDKVER